MIAIGIALGILYTIVWVLIFGTIRLMVTQETWELRRPDSRESFVLAGVWPLLIPLMCITYGMGWYLAPEEDASS